MPKEGSDAMIGVKVIGVLMLLTGIITGFYLFDILLTPGTVPGTLSEKAVYTGILIITAASFAGAVGLFRTEKWGIYTATGYYITGILLEIFLLFNMPERMSYIRLITSSAVLIYLLKKKDSLQP